MIRFYFHPTPNPAKVALFLEESGLTYELVPVDTSKGEEKAEYIDAIKRDVQWLGFDWANQHRAA